MRPTLARHSVSRHERRFHATHDARRSLAAAPPVVVSAHGVVKRYGRTVALAGLDAEIGTGITGLLGSNGAGKTTFLSLVGLAPAVQGIVADRLRAMLR
jgi:ATPase subunit of ABC transporter with duplicated ATPase domains